MTFLNNLFWMPEELMKLAERQTKK